MKERLRANPPLAYALILASTGMAKGMWQGAYAWFLSARLQLTPTQIGLVIGSQFIAQILLEMPSGAWADRGLTRRVLASGHLAFAAYCAVYFFTAHAHITGKPALILAFGAEALFGIGAALYSGTLEAWIGERERAAANESSPVFAMRLRRVHSLSALWGSVPCAVFGGIAFAVATQGRPGVPWLLGGAGYLVALAVTLVAVDTNTRTVEAGQIDVLQMVGGQVSRAMAFLQEQPKTFRLFLCGSLAYMPFYATQLLWFPFLAKTLGIRAGDTLGHGELPIIGSISLIASLWCAGELARSLGGLVVLDNKTVSARSSLLHVVLALMLYTLALAMQIASVLLDGHQIVLFAVGYILGRLNEGRLRRNLAVLKDRWILSERGTLQSLDALVRAIAGLVFLTLVGALFEADPILGYVMIAIVAAIAVLEFSLLRASIHDDVPITLSGIRKPSAYGTWNKLLNRFFFSRYFFYTVTTVLFAVVPLVLPHDALPLWTFLDEKVRDGAVVDVQAVSENSVRVEPELRRDLHGENLVRTTWRITGGSTAAPVGCRVPIHDPFDLWEANLEGDIRGRIRRIEDQYVLEFGVAPEGNAVGARPNSPTDRATRVVLGPSTIDDITCYRLTPGGDLDFSERQVIPARIKRLSPHIAPGAGMVLPEMIGAFVLLSLLFGTAFWVARSQLQDVLDVAPATLLNSAREHAGVPPDKILEPTQGLPISDFEPFDALLVQLGGISGVATSFIIGGFSQQENAKTHKPGTRVEDLWYHEYGQLVFDKTANARLAAWVIANFSDGDGADSRTRRLNDPVRDIETDDWNINRSEHRQIELARRTGMILAVEPELERKSHRRFAACAIVRRPDRDQQGKYFRCGFAIAVFGRDRASRYVSPVDRQLLLMLADLARLQAALARVNADLWNEIHLAKGEFDRIRVPLEEVEAAVQANIEHADMPSAALSIGGTLGRIRFMMERFEYKLRPRSPGTEAKNAVSMLADVRRIAAQFTHSLHGAMTVVVDNELDDDDDVMVVPSRLFVVEGTLTELLWNAGKHGGTEQSPDVEVKVTVANADGGDAIEIRVENALPTDAPDEGEATGWGLQTLPKTIEAIKGRFIPLAIDRRARWATVGFVLARNTLEGKE